MALSEGQNNGENAQMVVVDQKLPYGWSSGVNDDGMVFYKNNITREIQYEVPTQRAKPKPKAKKNNNGEQQRATATELAAQRKKEDMKKIQPSTGTRRCISLCVGAPYINDYNEEYSDFSEKNSGCKSFVCSIGFHTISTCKNGGCMLILLPWAIIVDILLLFISFILFPFCGLFCYCAEGGRVGCCCLGTFLLRSSVCHPCCFHGECDCARCLYFAEADGRIYG